MLKYKKGKREKEVDQAPVFPLCIKLEQLKSTQSNCSNFRPKISSFKSDLKPKTSPFMETGRWRFRFLNPWQAGSGISPNRSLFQGAGTP
jgi:hypothetical protein